jgi:hypothetical protein
MIPAAEAAVQRRLTEAFVDADAEEVVLQALVKVMNGAGGFSTSRIPRPPQIMRLSPSGTGVERQLPDGRIVTSSHTLLGYYGTVMDRGDWFTLGGREYEIVFVHENQEYQTKGEVILRG